MYLRSTGDKLNNFLQFIFLSEVWNEIVWIRQGYDLDTLPEAVEGQRGILEEEVAGTRGQPCQTKQKFIPSINTYKKTVKMWGVEVFNRSLQTDFFQTCSMSLSSESLISTRSVRKQMRRAS